MAQSLTHPTGRPDKSTDNSSDRSNGFSERSNMSCSISNAGSAQRSSADSADSKRSIVSALTSSIPAQHKYKARLVKKLHDKELGLAAGRDKQVKTMLRRSLMLLCVPIFGASRAIGFKWAENTSPNGVPTGIASLVASSMSMSFLLTLLALRYGRTELRECASKRYLKMSLGGSFNGLAKCFAFAAIQRLSPAVQDVLMQAGMLFLLGINAIFLQSLPKCTTCILTMLVIALATLFVISYQTDDETEWIFDTLGLMCGLAASLSEMAGDALIEYAAMDSEVAETSSAEIVRVLVMNEAWKLPVTVVFCFVFDSEYMLSDHPTDWIPYLLAGGVAPLCLNVGFSNLCIALYGSIPVNLAASLRVLLIYGAEVILLRLVDLDIRLVLVLVGLVAALALNTMIEKDALDAQVYGELAALRWCREAAERTDGRSSPAPVLAPFREESRVSLPVWRPTCQTPTASSPRSSCCEFAAGA